MTDREGDPDITVIQRELFAPGRSKARRYADLVVGRPGVWALIKHELITTLCSGVPGALGLWLRSKLYRLLLGAAGTQRDLRGQRHVATPPQDLGSATTSSSMTAALWMRRAPTITGFGSGPVCLSGGTRS